jgi:hypothetical protein
MNLRKTGTLPKNGLDRRQERVTGQTMQNQRGQQIEAGAAPLDSTNEDAMGGPVGPRVNRQDIDRSKPPRETGEQLVQPIGPVDDCQAAIRLQKRNRRAEPAVEAFIAKDVRRHPRLIG